MAHIIQSASPPGMAPLVLLLKGSRICHSLYLECSSWRFIWLMPAPLSSPNQERTSLTDSSPLPPQLKYESYYTASHYLLSSFLANTLIGNKYIVLCDGMFISYLFHWTVNSRRTGCLCLLTNVAPNLAHHLSHGNVDRFFFFLSFCLFRATPAAYEGSQARGRIRARVTSLRRSHSNE